MMVLLESIIGAVRPIQFRGKGLVFNRVAARSGTRTVRVWGNYKMMLNLANVIHRQIFMGCFSRDMTVWTRALLPVGGVFLDVGAHIGYFSLLAAHCVGPRGLVYSLEPNPAAFATLQDHLKTNAIINVQAQMIALSEANGALRLYIPPLNENRDYNVSCIPRSDWTAVEVPCRRLDECLEEWKTDRIDLMKMDVEGAEPLVLAGGAKYLKDGAVRYLIVEVNGPRLTEGGSSPTQLVKQLAGLGFVPARISGGRAIVVSPEEWDLDPTHEYDRLFMHQSVQ